MPNLDLKHHITSNGPFNEQGMKIRANYVNSLSLPDNGVLDPLSLNKTDTHPPLPTLIAWSYSLPLLYKLYKIDSTLPSF